MTEDMARKGYPLEVIVKDGLLSITIGIDTLTWASRPENGGPIEGPKVDRKMAKEWAKDIAYEICREDEVGDSPINRFLDKMMIEAKNNGSQALIWPKK